MSLLPLSLVKVELLRQTDGTWAAAPSPVKLRLQLRWLPRATEALPGPGPVPAAAPAQVPQPVASRGMPLR